MLSRRSLWPDRSVSPLGALAACAPGDFPEATQSELLPLREVIQDAIDSALSERERRVFDAYYVERKSFRAMALSPDEGGLGIPRTTCWRVRNSAVDKLRAALADHELIRTYLER